MEKVIIFICFLTVAIYAQDTDVEKNCHSCHKSQQIPTKMIYKRYLMNYSTDEYMERAIFDYLKNPNKKNSIMPKVFFTKFPMKPKTKLNDKELRENIHSYLKEFDIKKRLILKK
jgi:hypothetical protein